MGNEQSFNNKIPLKIKKYNIEKNIGKEIDDLITAGRFFVQFKYLLENDCNLNIINNTNINVSININNYNNEIQKKDENNLILIIITMKSKKKMRIIQKEKILKIKIKI